MNYATRLWSLWDMLEFNTERFNRIMRLITQMREVFAPIKIPPQDEIPTNLTQILDQNIPILIEDIDGVLEDMNQMGMRASAACMQRLKDYFQVLSKAFNEAPDGEFDRDKPAMLLRDVERTVHDELEGQLFLYLPPSEAQKYSSTSSFMETKLLNKFPSITYEVEEASKCLALNRSTAAAFHLLRCLEAGILAMARCLAIPDPIKGADRNWGVMLKKINGGMDAKWPTSSNRMSGDGRIFDEFYGALSGMKNPYRNATMHLDEKYTQDEAEHLYVLVGGLMKSLANRMDENGKPLA